MRAVTDRTGTTATVGTSLDKVFPRHMSFLWGEVALYAFVVLVVTGTYLTLFFDASQARVVYDGTYAPLRGLEVSAAYASVMHISFDVRAGLLVRQIHHWAALVFVAAIVVHLGRVYFTAAYRRPRDLNWVVGCTLLLAALAMGFTGYSLPDDSLSGTGLRIADSVALSIPVAGEWISSLLFGTSWPSDVIVARLFPIHVFLLPIAVMGLLGAHLAIVWRQKHTQFPGTGRTEENVVGERVWPGFAMKSLGLLSLTAGVLTLLGAFAQINPIWLYGPYDPAATGADAQPDWYIGWLEGALRLMPPWELRAFGYTVPNPFLPGVVLPGVMFTVLFAVPWLDRRLGGDDRTHHLLQRPRDAPVRTAAGVGAIAFVVVLSLAGAQDVIARTFSVPLGTVRSALRIALVVAPVVAAIAAHRIARALGRRSVLRDTVSIRRREDGGMVDVPVVDATATPEGRA